MSMEIEIISITNNTSSDCKPWSLSHWLTARKYITFCKKIYTHSYGHLRKSFIHLQSAHVYIDLKLVFPEKKSKRAYPL